MNFESVFIESNEFDQKTSLEKQVLNFIEHFFRKIQFGLSLKSISKTFTVSGDICGEKDSLKIFSDFCKKHEFDNQQIIRFYGKFLKAMKFNIDCEKQKPVNSELEAFVKLEFISGKTSYCASFFKYFDWINFNDSEMIQIFYKTKNSGIENLFLKYYDQGVSAPFLHYLLKSERESTFTDIFRNIFKIDKELDFYSKIEYYYPFHFTVEDNFILSDQTNFFLQKFRERLMEYFTNSDESFSNFESLKS